MSKKPTYEALEERVTALEKAQIALRKSKEELDQILSIPLI
jgi:O-acetylhomoserine/O-acetylserine sulfhydrylase-like pyridoxal-dependent enzyme